MIKRLTLACVSVAAFILFLTCTDSVTGPEGPQGELPRALSESEQMLIEADREFSYHLFKRTVAWDDEENIFISPFSVSMALAMTLNLSLIHISEPTRLRRISYAVFCLKKKK